jgi:phosphoadenosine phosphosulfate reductase
MYWRTVPTALSLRAVARCLRGQSVISSARRGSYIGVQADDLTDPAGGPREPFGVADLRDDRWQDEVLVVPADAAISETSGQRLNEAFRRLDPADRLRFLSRNVPGPLVFTTSFGLEDQALTHLIIQSGVAQSGVAQSGVAQSGVAHSGVAQSGVAQSGVAHSGIDFRFATLDTGRLFPETHAVWAATEQRYGIRVEAFHPRAGALDALVQANGINGFYHSTKARHACCAVRKVEPLGRALQGAAVWLTGLRADQSASRRELDFVSYDTDRRLLKVSPLLDCSRDQVAALVRDAGVPYNALHDKGFLSIGCAPCTRAVAPGEPERAGRWWWEQDEARECGLHLTLDGRLVRGGKPS